MVRRAVRELTPEEKRGRAMKVVGYGCGGLVVLVLVALLVMYILARSAPPLPKALREAQQAVKAEQARGGQVPQAPGMQPQPQAGQGYQAPTQATPSSVPVQQQVQQVEQAAREGRTGSFEIDVTQADLNRQLARQVGRNGLSNAAVAFLDGQIAATGTAHWNGRSFQALVKARPTLDGDHPRLVITEAYIGKLPAPKEAVTRLQAALDKTVDKAVANVRGAKITRFVVEGDKLVIDGYLAGPGQ